MISIASVTDVPELVSLINSAYRGESSKRGWTTEADLLEGELRTDEPTLRDIIKKPGSVILKYVDNNKIKGSVYLDVQERGLYLGMLTVDPNEQAGGIGKKLMQAAEDFGKEKGCSKIFMNVISVRDELVAWYERQGYYKTGEKRPLPEDTRFGKPTRELEFCIMQKDIGS
jgi:ribosomal protein S18 acetylase RimI-like enzyme